MEPLYKVEKDILEEAIHCQNDFRCLGKDVPKYIVTERGYKGLVCASWEYSFCFYKIEFDKQNTFCGCPVLKEIHKKYKQ